MAKPTKQQEPESEAAIMERMNEALKKMMTSPHETQKEMVARRRGHDAAAKRAARKERKT